MNFEELCSFSFHFLKKRVQEKESSNLFIVNHLLYCSVVPYKKYKSARMPNPSASSPDLNLTLLLSCTCEFVDFVNHPVDAREIAISFQLGGFPPLVVSCPAQRPGKGTLGGTRFDFHQGVTGTLREKYRDLVNVFGSDRSLCIMLLRKPRKGSKDGLAHLVGSGLVNTRSFVVGIADSKRFGPWGDLQRHVTLR